MSNRPNPYVKHFGLVKPLIDFAQQTHGLGLEKSLIKLVEIRASQINGCGVCLDMHSKEAIAQGETAKRIIMLDAWRESSLYTPREKAALAWIDSLTQLAEKGAPDDIYDELNRHFSEEEIVKLTLSIGIINVFNRIGVGFQVPPISEQTAKAA